MAPSMHLGIVGLGLIGGSLAQAFRRVFPDAWIAGVDRKPGVLERARADGTLDAACLFGTDEEDTFAVFAPCDFVFVCTPVDVTARHAARVARHCRGVISDVGSCKTAVMRDVAALPDGKAMRFIGGHPMAGSERIGYAFARANLFENAIYVLCLPEGAPPSAEVDARALADLVAAIGALPVRLDAVEHDRTVGLVSHLPHVAAAALSAVAAREGATLRDPERVKQLAAGGFRDITRIASSSPDLWAGIAADGSSTLLPALDAYIRLLSEYRTRLAAPAGPDRTALAALFEEGRAFRDAVATGGRGVLEGSATLVVSIDDRPGAIAAIATALGDHGIGIRNLNIVNSRVYEGGCLHVQIDERQLDDARRVLQGAGHDCV
jgi:prephenate dehydrogenase